MLNKPAFELSNKNKLSVKYMLEMNDAATGSSAEPSATTTTKTKSKKHAKSNAPPLVCDPVIINHVQEAIIHIKASRQQCNIPGIFVYLKERLPDNDKIAALTEKNLIQQLELAVREGILSRKYTSNMKDQVSPSSKLVTTYCSPPPQIVYKLPKPESFLTHIENDQVGCFFYIF